jgi:hypothetical protein
MDEKKSRIDSFGVSLGQPQRNGIPKKTPEPWNILVCSDLGYSSLVPKQVLISEWNDFISSCAVMVSGSVENKVADDGKPVFAEFPISSLKDFNGDAIIRTIQPWASYAQTATIVEDLAAGTRSLNDAVSSVKKAGLPGNEEARVLRLLNAGPSGRAQKSASYPAPAAGAKVDSILSMIDLPSAITGVAVTAGPAKATDALISAVAGSSAAMPDSSALRAYASDLNARLEDQLRLLKQQPFFSSRALSWNALMTLAKVIGRNNNLRLHVVSAEYQDCTDAIATIVDSCRDRGFIPDIVVWDYDVSLSNADVDRMERVAVAAEQANSVVVMSLSMADPLFIDLDKKDTVVSVLQEVRLLPYKKLRSRTASRCLCLCGPAMGGDADKGAGAGRCSWFIATRWAEQLLSGNNPFGVKQSRAPLETVYASQEVFMCDYAPAVIEECGTMGFSLFGKRSGDATPDRLASVIDPQHAEPAYLLFMFNLLVNRVVRLCGMVLRDETTAKGIDDTAAAMSESLIRELSSYGAITGDGQVSVVVLEGAGIRVEVDSEVTMSGNPLRFSFSF